MSPDTRLPHCHLLAAPHDGAHVCATTASGVPVYLRLRQRAPPSAPKTRIATPIYQLLSRLESDRHLAEINQKHAQEEQPAADQHMWVQKHAPTRFTDLASAERCNIEVLQWVTAWRQPTTRPDKKVRPRPPHP